MSALSAEPKRRLTEEEYLEIEDKAEFKSEFFNGEMFPLGGAPHMMAGGRPDHSLIAANLTAALSLRLRGGRCRIYNSDLRVHVASTGLCTYPDVTVVCGERLFTKPERGVEALRNPTVLCEVLSPTTEGYDRGGKFFHYQQIESLREYVLVATDLARVETFARQAEPHRWLLTVTEGLTGVAALAALGVELPLAEVYDGAEFPPGPILPPAPAA